MNFYTKTKILILLLLLPGILMAQNLQISGIVTDSENFPLPGANVMVKGTSTGTICNAQGEYEIQVPEKGNILVFSFIGMTNQEFTISDATTINVSLVPDLLGLDEVVVIGYGTIKKKDLTGAIESLSGDELVKSMNVNIAESLNGRISGVHVTKSSNKPGASMSIQIRGLNSINSSNEPLYVIDGIPSYSGMKHLNPSDIESIDVLKDASSCAIYGSRGANGVVIITTKGANAKKGFSIEYSSNVGLKTPYRIPDMIGNLGNGDEYVDYRIALWKMKYGDAGLMRTDFLTEDEKARIKSGEYYDWIREISDNSMTTNHSINSSGGNENTTYTFGVGYMLDDGMVGKEEFKRYTANVGLEHKFSEKIKTGVSTYISRTNTNYGSNNALLNAYFIPPIVSPYDSNGDYLFNAQPTSSRINPFLQNENTIQETESFYSNFSGFIEYSPIKDLRLKSMLAYQFDSHASGSWIGTFTQEKAGINPPEAAQSNSNNINMVWDNILTYDKEFNSNNKLNIIGLFSMQQDSHQGNSMRGDDIPYDSYWYAIQTAEEIRDVTSYYWESSMISYMLRANYALLNKYMLTVTGRYDGTSRLAGDNQWGFLPAVALGWQLKNEAFLKDVDFIDQLKLRLSYGKTGNNNLGHDITLTKLNLSRYAFGETGANGFGISGSKGNMGLNWEMTSEYNLGLDFGLFNHRIDGTLDVYSRTTEDLIFNRSIGSINGYTSVFQNIGTTGNKGIEMGLRTVNISKQNFHWKTSLTFSLNRNRIIDLYGDNQDDLGNRWFIGEPIHVIYDFNQIGIWQTEDKDLAAEYGQSVGHIRVEDVDENFSMDEKDFQILGSPTPDFTTGLINTFVYNNFDLMIDAYARVGGLYSDDFTYMFTAWDNEHWNKLDVEYWTPENGANKYQQVGAISYYTQVLARVPGTFVKVRNITLGYNIGVNTLNKLNIKQLRFYTSIQNPFTFTNYLGSDPEIIGENVYSQLSIYPRTFNMGFNVNF